MIDARQKDWGWLLLVVFFLLVAAAFTARALLSAGNTPLINDTDDAMRLVTVRDLIAGQNWFDTIQHRLNTPYGAELHWSRLVDLPIAGLLLLLQPLAGANAVTLVAFLWPLTLLFLVLLLSAVLTTQLVGRRGRLAAVALPALSLVTMAEFAPGRLDHHSIQILLMLGIVSATIAALERPRFALLAGVLAATAMAIGTESIPTVAAAIMAFGLIWVFRPERADALRFFGVSFAMASVVHLALFLPPDLWFAAACDALSIVYVAVAVVVGIAYLVLSLLPRLGLMPRAAALVAAGLAAGLVVILGFPDCLRGPYAALDPWLVQNWLGRISEAEPVWERLIAEPRYTLAVVVPPVLALLVTGLRVWRGDRQGRANWFVYGLFLALGIVVMLVQIRASRFATSLAVPGGALAIVWLRERYLNRQVIQSALGLVGGWLAFSGLAIFIVVAAVVALVPGASRSSDQTLAAGKASCLQPQAFADLAALPPERIMSPIDLGSHLLAYTPHEVVGGPYHRNERGVRDTFAFFNDPIDKARIILDIRGISLVVTCAGMPEMAGRPDAAPDSFVRLYRDGQLPDWLVSHSLPSAALQVFSVQR
jgi:hypothetical protein